MVTQSNQGPPGQPNRFDNHRGQQGRGFADTEADQRRIVFDAGAVRTDRTGHGTARAGIAPEGMGRESDDSRVRSYSRMNEEWKRRIAKAYGQRRAWQYPGMDWDE